MPENDRKSQSKICMTDTKKIAVIIVAAGRGTRAGTDGPKQYEKICGKAIIDHTLKSISSSIKEATIVPVIHKDDHQRYEQLTHKNCALPPVIGGETRQESVLNGLLALQDYDPDYVLIHDAARPFIVKETIEKLISGLNNSKRALLPAVPIVDTLKHVTEDIIEKTVDRTSLYAVQTPQAFRYGEILEAHKNAPHKNFTDDAAVFEHFGGKVTIVDGLETNFKITRPEDFLKATNLMMMQLADIRVGSGYDVHRFDKGDHVWLGGIKIPHTHKLKGHSDADVALHALTDAILAAISEGDIGTHFPPSDEQWRGAPSHIFLEKAQKLVAEKDGIIAHVGICIICEKPKIGPHKDTIRQKIADLLDIEISRVSVQATTTEKLGFTGREEGIACQATATIRLPLD
ncbi:bifunctional 2-C-methyl-D-erythritol 4-phosphate cytidylyltransferase/2-C-methyl-D-erythritol 2,4-cyclodiphosphate synthase [Kordiimonas sp. SCSIO 12603]|uniref:bifunctional 2-C-methyl-D-erythritol 4-phosphate cytidylyltransferase/2-C-methyl-D-erythritol 2,4-cyclodiphosphate synthase n=1 Tax=Kordiimonas sp. SCSIO 12603 TaxID=2829596 RepID=UPI0021046E90|nr:bifunctional 2-C-methyl-D-erythritol 4-phosphate cytidylyltransferase/2-C-methyl-D-erythritol 2,4-cyclodiphosphate synthase [Kordiimonas sp. SCSIO 12603]UTW57444.1 bifunctional 2-C-methyl-D-erythritol 4-phosphate cytidylyltransferase/2-C-methyl-D-erythritol 2,4-cyclodiphosphate synthase [Kordiimonas sp. SCSIO 12603]